MTETVDPGLVLVRAVTFALAILVVGAACFALYAPGAKRHAAGAFTGIAAPVGLSLAGFAYLALLAREVSGAPGPPQSAVVAQLVATTGFGRALAGTVLAAAALALAGAARGGARLRAGLAVLAAVPLAFVGHGADGQGWAQICRLALMGLHLIAVGVWLGALPSLWRALDRRGPDSLALLRRFGDVGAVAVALVLATGIGTLAFILAASGWSLGAGYRNALILKLAFVAGLLVLAAINRFGLTPLAARDPDRALPALRRSIVMEQVLGLAAVASVALLGQLDPTM